MLEFDVSDDAKEVVYSAQPPGKPLQLWLGTLDRSSPPQLISASGEDSPHFGPDGRIVYRSFDGTNHYLAQMNRDGSGRSRVVPYPIGNILSMSPDRRWITTAGTMPNGGGGTFAVPVAGGAPQRICSGCPVTWAPDGRFLYLFVQKPSLSDPGKTRVIPLPPGEMLPKLPPLGMRAPGRPEALSRFLPHRRIWNLAESGPLRLRLRENHDAPESISDPTALEKGGRLARCCTTSATNPESETIEYTYDNELINTGQKLSLTSDPKSASS